MATTNYITTWFLVLVLMIASSSATTTTSFNARTDIARAIEELQKANYFTFVLLINLAPPELLQGNLTFLMPKDKTLSGNTITHQSLFANFLLHHSIPSPLLFENLQLLPTGSIIPTSKNGLFLNVTNNGSRRSFFLNNVRITSPNICISGSSIRCHGIDGVIQPLRLPATPRSNIPPSPPPPPPSPGAAAESPRPAAPLPSVIGLNKNLTTAPPPYNSSQPHKSGGFRPQLMIESYDFILLKTLTCLVLLAVKLSM